MNDRRDSAPKRARRLGLIAAGALVLSALAGHAAFANDTPGNNGTVKIHEGAGEPSAEVRNEPHVCTFHLHFFFSDPEQAGTWEIQKWAPGSKGTVVLAGTYDTAGDGEDRQPETGAYGLPNGHYKLFWDGDLDTGKHDKMKVFWVDCEGEVQGLTPTPTPVTPNKTQTSSSESQLPVGDTTGSGPGQDLAASGAGGTSVTPPPTDTDSVETARTEASWPIVLLIIATILVTASLLTPVKRDR